MKRLTLLVALLAWIISADASIVQVDYSYDAANGNFFGSNPTAKAALNAAAFDIGNAISSSLGPVTTDIYSGTNGSTTATFDWSLAITNPSTGTATTLNTFSFPANTVSIAVGVRSLAGSTLGVGGPSSAGISLGVSGFAGSVESEFVGAIASAESSSNASMPRGGGPIIGTISGTRTIGSTTANFNVKYGAMLGSLSFNSTSTFHYDHTTPVLAGENDFYSVALHEILHAIGFGTSQTWNSLRSGTTWNGPNANALGSFTLSADGGHIAEGAMSTRITDGTAQEAAMDPTLTVGTRKFLTQLDLAYLRDIGFTTVPEPTSGVLCFGAGFVLVLVRRRKVVARLA